MNNHIVDFFHEVEDETWHKWGQEIVNHGYHSDNELVEIIAKGLQTAYDNGIHHSKTIGSLKCEE